jgi:hypothetical protein
LVRDIPAGGGKIGHLFYGIMEAIGRGRDDVGKGCVIEFVREWSKYSLRTLLSCCSYINHEHLT